MESKNKDPVMEGYLRYIQDDIRLMKGDLIGVEKALGNAQRDERYALVLLSSLLHYTSKLIESVRLIMETRED